MKRLLPLVLPLVLVLLLTACGVRPTDGVISAGPAPAFPGRNHTEMTLYFLLDGRVYPTTRATPGVASPESTLRALVSGPNDEERRVGRGAWVGATRRGWPWCPG